MNREIKFRGKHFRDREWRYSSSEYTKETILSTHTVSSAMFWRDVECGIIIPETVGQYTGLKDKNDVEIYEGDIVRCDHEYIGDIKYDSHHEGGGRFYPDFDCEIFLDKQRWYRLEIIGNVCENPELLEVK